MKISNELVNEMIWQKGVGEGFLYSELFKEGLNTASDKEITIAWTAIFPANDTKLGWNSEIMNLKGMALSMWMAKEVFPNATLVVFADAFTEGLLKNVNTPEHAVVVAEKPEYLRKELWSTLKLNNYIKLSEMGRPFLHIDSDVYIGKNFPAFLGETTLFQGTEHIVDASFCPYSKNELEVSGYDGKYPPMNFGMFWSPNGLTEDSKAYVAGLEQRLTALPKGVDLRRLNVCVEQAAFRSFLGYAEGLVESNDMEQNETASRLIDAIAQKATYCHLFAGSKQMHDKLITELYERYAR